MTVYMVPKFPICITKITSHFYIHRQAVAEFTIFPDSQYFFSFFEREAKKTRQSEVVSWRKAECSKKYKNWHEKES